MAKYKILVVDDQRDIRRMLRHALEGSGLELEIGEVPSGEEARLMMTHRAVDLLILDVYLPGMSGLELQRWAKLHSPQTKIIFVTGMVDPEVRRQASAAGVEAVFFKPLEIVELLETVRRCMGVVVEPPPDQVAEFSLSTLCGELEASALLLLGAGGRILDRAGTLPDGIDWDGLISHFMQAAEAGAQASQLLSTSAIDYLFYLQGDLFNLALVAVSETTSLLAIDAPSQDRGRFLEALRSRHAAIQSISPTARQDRDSSENLLEPVIPQPDLDAVFDAKEASLSNAALDAFWESAVEENESSKGFDPDSIPYEQARKLGLAPGEE